MFVSSRLEIFTIAFLLSMFKHEIYGQTVRPHLLCTNNSVTVIAGASGVIQHVKEGRDTPCTLRLRGFASGSYLSLPDLDTPANNCGASVTVNSINYCVKGSQFFNRVIIPLTGGELSVTLSSARENNFEFHYYSNVAICKRILTIPEGAKASQLSGVISSSYNISTQVSLEDCRVGIELPSPNVTLRVELLYTSSGIDIQVGDKMFPPSASRGDTILVMTRSEKSISLSATKGDDDNPTGRFVIRVTVLHCGDIPEIPHSTNSTTPTPWLPGSEITYSFVSGWMLNQTKENSIECQVDGSSKTARWTSHTNIHCIPAECNLTADQVNISNGKSVVKRYCYGDRLDYECHDGYKQVTDVICTSDGTWSTTPICRDLKTTYTPSGATGATAPSQSGPIIGVGVTSTLAGLELCLIIAMAIYIQRRVAHPQPANDYDEVAAAISRAEAVSERKDYVNMEVVDSNGQQTNNNSEYESVEMSADPHEYEKLSH